MHPTKAFLLTHAARYPALQLADCYKALHQSALGCEHLISDPSAAADDIRREAASCVLHGAPESEGLDGDFVRVHLDWVRRGLPPEVLADRLVRSSARVPEGVPHLEEKLAVLLSLCREGALPFSPAEAEDYIRARRAEGFPAVHHSDLFRARYAPAYRVLRRDLAADLEDFLR